MKRILEMRSSSLHDYWSRIDKVSRGHFQRRVRRVWLVYKKNKEEKEAERKRKEEMLKKKRKRHASVLPNDGRAMPFGRTMTTFNGTGGSRLTGNVQDLTVRQQVTDIFEHKNESLSKQSNMSETEDPTSETPSEDQPTESPLPQPQSEDSSPRAHAQSQQVPAKESRPSFKTTRAS
eukprot:CAMPEP_0170501056 /NCGR_PEP_ID=MMETSP0208-20121228/36993_1 /TAXON_ID=197538 /ORGANISM="Strombidium inclinatum, Strain S3" /LENGTH=176 /DNA_ID=CAMNT_0010779383 /DNA_START=2362 /DNA_END=2892 /DNA_ORIENTATION=+